MAAHQTVGQSLGILLQVHEVVIVACGKEDSHCGQQGKQEAAGGSY